MASQEEQVNSASPRRAGPHHACEHARLCFTTIFVNTEWGRHVFGRPFIARGGPLWAAAGRRRSKLKLLVNLSTAHRTPTSTACSESCRVAIPLNRTMGSRTIGGPMRRVGGEPDGRAGGSGHRVQTTTLYNPLRRLPVREGRPADPVTGRDSSRHVPDQGAGSLRVQNRGCSPTSSATPVIFL